jgi:hypothetical protein
MSVCQPNTTFKGVQNITEELLLNNIEANLKMFLDWAFLNIGAWFDVDINESSLQNESYDKLTLVNDHDYTNGQVWESVRKDWVWEDCTFNNRSPRTPIVKVNNVVVSPSNYIINYSLGRIIFNNPISLSSNVKSEYSYRHIQVYRANETDWFNIIQYNGPSTTKSLDRLSGGDWKINKTHTIQPPLIVVESLPRSRSKPHEIGSNGLVLEQDFAFHIFADNKNERNKIVDILRLQQDLMILLFDINAVSADDKYPLNYDGSLKTNPLMYPEIVGQYGWKKCWLKNIAVFESESIDPALHRAAVRVTAEIIYT